MILVPERTEAKPRNRVSLLNVAWLWCTYSMLKGETEPIIMTGTIGKEKRKEEREFKEEEEECVFLLLHVHGGEKAY